MSHKNRIMRQIISNVSGNLPYEEILTPQEMCTLHKLISSSVEPHEMHNELRTCPWQILNTTSHIPNVQSKMPQPLFPNRRQFSNHTVIGPNFSRCPLELGASYSDYGAVHIGNVIAAIASGMQPQNIRISDFVAEYREQDPFENLETMEETDNRQKMAKVISSLSSVDNTYASGLAGEFLLFSFFTRKFTLNPFRRSCRGNSFSSTGSRIKFYNWLRRSLEWHPIPPTSSSQRKWEWFFSPHRLGNIEWLRQSLRVTAGVGLGIED